MSSVQQDVVSADAIAEINRRFYDGLWSRAQLIEAERFNTWPLIQTLMPHAPRRLEVAPGLRPRLPVRDTCFVDISGDALNRLRQSAELSMQGSVLALPFTAGAFDLVCAFDVVEHVVDDDLALTELSRVAARGAALVLSVPLHPSAWTPFDTLVGHCRRYRPAELMSCLARHGLQVERSAVYGMQPRQSWLLDLGMWFLERHPRWAMWWYNHFMMPLSVRFQKPLRWMPGMIDTDGVDEVVLLCRKG